MGQAGIPQAENSSPLLHDQRLDGNSPRMGVARSADSGASLYRLPMFPRSVSICQLAGGASEEESLAHKRIQQKLIAALILAFIFMIVEVVGGIWAHSLAIITDAAHLLSDCSGFGVAVLAAYWAKRRSHEHFSYGYHRVEVLGALASVMTVWLVTGLLLFEAVQRIINPEPVNGKLMFIIALTGVCVNILMMAILGHHHHGPAHTHAPQAHAAGHSHADDAHSHSHAHAHGAGCNGHGHSGEGSGPVLEAAELNSASSNNKLPTHAAAASCTHDHDHAHEHGPLLRHNHSHSHVPAAAADLEAAETGQHKHKHGEHCKHGHGHKHGHNKARDSDDATHHHHAHSHSEGEEEEEGCSGRTPILKPAGQAHRSCGGEGHSHEHGHGSSGGVLAVVPPPRHPAGGCSHDHANMNVRGAIIHVIGDFVQSIGVCIAGALIWYHQGDPRWYIADPICTFLFAILVLWTTRAILRDISDVLMERVPRGLCINTIHDDMSRVAGVEEVHDLHVWSLTPGIPLLCAHINLSPEADATAALHLLTNYCRAIGIQHSTLQLVTDGSACC